MKVIFLDIDGVLNVYPQGRDKFGSKFHKEFEENLKHIIDETGAKIVISSTWRMSGLEVMKEMWKHRHLPGEVIDITPLETVIIEENDDMSRHDDVWRGHEIKHWLENHTDVENYVILDDDSDMLVEQLSHFVKTSDNPDHEDSVNGIGYGLTRKCAEIAIDILNKK